MALINYWASFVFSYRQLHGLTQDQLAAKLSVSQQTVSRWEAGQQVPDPHSQAALRRVLGDADLNSAQSWRRRVRLASGFEFLFDRKLVALAVSTQGAEFFRWLPEDVIGQPIEKFWPQPRAKLLDQAAEKGFFDGALMGVNFQATIRRGTRSVAYAGDLWPVYSSDGGILMHACGFPTPVDHIPGVEVTEIENFVMTPNSLVGAQN